MSIRGHSFGAAAFCTAAFDTAAFDTAAFGTAAEAGGGAGGTPPTCPWAPFTPFHTQHAKMKQPTLEKIAWKQRVRAKSVWERLDGRMTRSLMAV
jgi:hypothetical protein